MGILNKSVYIAVLNLGHIRAELSNELLKMSHSSYKIKITYPNARPAAHNRNQIVKDFLASNFQYLLTIDEDIVPLKNPLELVEFDKDIIGCVCPQWQEGDTYFVVMDKVDGGYKQIPVDRRVGLQEVDAVGSGCILISRRVLEVVEAPFIRQWTKEGLQALGLDFNFCEKARAKGFKVWAHFDYLCSHFKELDLLEVIKLVQRYSKNG